MTDFPLALAWGPHKQGVMSPHSAVAADDRGVLPRWWRVGEVCQTRGHGIHDVARFNMRYRIGDAPYPYIM